MIEQLVVFKQVGVFKKNKIYCIYFKLVRHRRLYCNVALSIKYASIDFDF